jgi:hypothetical protein
MKIVFGAGLLSAILLLSGCSLFHHKSASPSAQRNPPQQTAPATAQPQPAPFTKPVIKADLRAWGQIVKVNTDARFVVISFDAGAVPQTGKRFNVYRNGVKVGEVNITGPQQESNTVADIVSGDIQLHDEARAD